MPIWALIYCGIIVIGTVVGLFSKARLKTTYQPIGELMCGFCGIWVFLSAFYEGWSFNKFIVTIAFIYVNFWFYYAHRHNYKYQNARDYIHTQNLENDEKLKKELGDKFEPQYSFESSEKELKYYYTFLIVGSIFLYLPFLYVYTLAVELGN